MKKVLFIILMGMLYSQCDESNWQDYYPDMQGCDLEGAYLSDANLEGANLYLGSLYGATLSGANLQGADLSCVNLSDSYLYNTELSYTIWDECGITDGNGDCYDDVSYEAGAESGDLNLDGVDNVLDVVILVDNILTP